MSGTKTSHSAIGVSGHRNGELPVPVHELAISLDLLAPERLMVHPFCRAAMLNCDYDDHDYDILSVSNTGRMAEQLNIHPD